MSRATLTLTSNTPAIVHKPDAAASVALRCAIAPAPTIANRNGFIDQFLTGKSK
jgi:hypothetical protein